MRQSAVSIISGDAVQRWMFAQFARGAVPPFSFQYGNRPSVELLTQWQYRHDSRRVDRFCNRHTFTYTDPATGLQVECECVLFRDFPAIEWLLRVRNTGTQDTPVLADVQAIDTSLMGGRKWKLHRALGSNAQREDFAPVVDDLKPGNAVHLAPVGGRSSNTVALPFFNLQTEDGGVVFAIGWSGQWAADFLMENTNSLRLRAGMEQTHLKLHPGEAIRTPRILLLFWQGEDEFIGFNRLRRFLLQHHVPRRRGKPVTLPFACTSCGPPDEANQATEQSQLELASQFVPYGVEYLWLDAGWFEGRWPNGVGNWFPRKDGFPRGLRPLADGVRRMGMKGLLLWFEPERVYEGTWIDREHPDWLLQLPGNLNRLLNLGHPAALSWLTDHLSQMIEREGIAVYRQDFNMDPLPFWRAADAPDRQGITEIRHVEGLYTLWDTLLKRHPDLLIDNCASGGRRLDLETISRSVALWRTDYMSFEPVSQQCHTMGISRYLPTTSSVCGYPDAYLLRSALNNGLLLWKAWVNAAPDEECRGLLPPEATWQAGHRFPSGRAKALAAEFRRLRAYFFGDFYPLTPYSTADDAWVAYQFHVPEKDAGIVLVFRRARCWPREQTVRLRALAPEKTYEMRLTDEHLRRDVFAQSGRELLQGLLVRLDRAPSSLLIEYRSR
jgi:alpha-galactosidase